MAYQSAVRGNLVSELPHRSHRAAALITVLLAGSFLACAETQNDMARSSSPSSSKMNQATAFKTKGTQEGIQGDRTLTGTVLEVTSDQIKVNTGEVQPRFLPLSMAKEKGTTIQKGDQLEIMLNDQNLVVDYHPVGSPGTHKIIQGQLSTALTIGQARAIIRTETGAEEGYEVRPQARSKVAAIPVGVPAAFLIDETNKIADATFGSEAVARAQAEWQKKSPIKGAHHRVEGTVMRPLTANEITIRTEDGNEQPYQVRSIIQDKLSKVARGQHVILMIDEERQVVDVAVPPQG
jgi:hypothetical protein